MATPVHTTTLFQRIRYRVDELWSRLRPTVEFTGTLLDLSPPDIAGRHVAWVQGERHCKPVFQMRLRITPRTVDRILALGSRQLHFTVRHGVVVDVRRWEFLDRFNAVEVELEA